MVSDLWIEQDGKKVYVGVITKVNNDGTIEVQTNTENIMRLFELRPDLAEQYFSTYKLNLKKKEGKE